MQDTLEQLMRVRVALQDNPGVHSVCFGLNQHGQLGITVHVESAAVVVGISDISMPLVFVPRTGLGAAACSSILKPPVLNKRWNSPVGGCNAGPRQAEMGSFGVLGYMHGDKSKMAFCTAAHVYQVAGKFVNNVYQPNFFENDKHIINDQYMQPISTLYSKYGLDCVIFYLDSSKRDWVRKSLRAKLMSTTSAKTELMPRTMAAYTGDIVSKVGASTGETTGVVDHLSSGMMTIRPRQAGAVLSCGGDSGAPWYNNFDGNWVGINIAGVWSNQVFQNAVSISATTIIKNVNFRPFYDHDEL